VNYLFVRFTQTSELSKREGGSSILANTKTRGFPNPPHDGGGTKVYHLLMDSISSLAFCS